MLGTWAAAHLRGLADPFLDTHRELLDQLDDTEGNRTNLQEMLKALGKCSPSSKSPPPRAVRLLLRQQDQVHMVVVIEFAGSPLIRLTQSFVCAGGGAKGGGE